jgi:hypothetical protein
MLVYKFSRFCRINLMKKTVVTLIRNVSDRCLSEFFSCTFFTGIAINKTLRRLLGIFKFLPGDQSLSDIFGQTSYKKYQEILTTKNQIPLLRYWPIVR